MSILLTQIKPNPLGKDRGGGIPNKVVAAEWIDIKNDFGQKIYLKGIVLEHLIYPNGSSTGIWQSVRDLSDLYLPPFETIRIHSGGNMQLTELDPIDIAGAQWHTFTGKYYVWNNGGDSARLRSVERNLVLDHASYLNSAPNGRILRRANNNLFL